MSSEEKDLGIPIENVDQLPPKGSHGLCGLGFGRHGGPPAPYAYHFVKVNSRPPIMIGWYVGRVLKVKVSANLRISVAYQSVKLIR